MEVYTYEQIAERYGKAVWVDDNGIAYCQVGMESPFYTVIKK